MAKITNKLCKPGPYMPRGMKVVGQVVKGNEAEKLGVVVGGSKRSRLRVIELKMKAKSS